VKCRACTTWPLAIHLTPGLWFSRLKSWCRDVWRLSFQSLGLSLGPVLKPRVLVLDISLGISASQWHQTVSSHGTCSERDGQAELVWVASQILSIYALNSPRLSNIKWVRYTVTRLMVLETWVSVSTWDSIYRVLVLILVLKKQVLMTSLFNTTVLTIDWLAVSCSYLSLSSIIVWAGWYFIHFEIQIISLRSQ